MSTPNADRKSPLAMTEDELQNAAVEVAMRVARGTTTISDATVVVELAARLKTFCNKRDEAST